MRTQIAAANWKMNLTFQQGEKLLDDILAAKIKLKDHQKEIEHEKRTSASKTNNQKKN